MLTSLFFIYSYLRAALLPNSLTSIRTKALGDFQKPVFNDTFAVPISLDKLLTKSLQVTVVSMTGQKEEIIVSYNCFNLQGITLTNRLIFLFRALFKSVWPSSIQRTLRSSGTTCSVQSLFPVLSPWICPPQVQPQLPPPSPRATVL